MKPKTCFIESADHEFEAIQIPTDVLSELWPAEFGNIARWVAGLGYECGISPADPPSTLRVLRVAGWEYVVLNPGDWIVVVRAIQFSARFSNSRNPQLLFFNNDEFRCMFNLGGRDGKG